MKLLRLPLILSAIALLPSGCALVQTQPVPLYRLDAGEIRVPEQSGELAVQLHRLGVADYLRSDALLQRQPDGSLVVTREARWAGPLAAELSEQVLAQLAWRLNTRKLVSEPLPEGFKPDVQVGLEITRLDSGPSEPAVLEARWRLQDGAGELRSSRVIRLVEEHSGSTADQVRAQSQLMQRLVAQLVAEIEPIAQAANRPASAPKAAAPRRNTETVERSPAMPVPIRTEVEVFRF